MNPSEVREIVGIALDAAGELVIDFTLTDKGRTFDPATNSMTGTNTTRTIRGFYYEDESGYQGRTNLGDHERQIYLDYQDSNGVVYEAKEGDVLVDPNGRSNTVSKIEETIAGADLALTLVMCN